MQLMKTTIKIIAFFGMLLGVVSLTAQNILYSEPFSSCEWPVGWETKITVGDQPFQVEETISADPEYGDQCILYLLDNSGRNESLTTECSSPYITPLNGEKVFIDYKINFVKNNLHPQVLEVYYEQGGKEYLFERVDSSLWGATFNDLVDRTIVIDNSSREDLRLIIRFDNGGRGGAIVSIDNVVFRGEDNRLCENATSVNLNEAYCLQGNNKGIDSGTSYPSCEGILTQRPIWYQFVAPESGFARVTTESNFNDVIDVFYGFCDGLTPFRCSNDDEYGFIGDDLYFRMTKDIVYYVRVTGYRNLYGIEQGDFCLTVNQVQEIPTPGDYDRCSGALEVDLNQVCTNGNNRDAKMDGPEPSLNTKSKADVWFKYVHSIDRPVDILTNANFSDVITVYSGSCLFLSEVVGTDQGPEFRQVDLVKDQTYYIQVSGYFSTLEGDLCLEIVESIQEDADNDDCVDAIELKLNDATCMASKTESASWSGVRPSCVVYPGDDVWYSFDSGQGRDFLLDIESDFPFAVALYEGDCDSLVEQRCMNDFHPCDGYMALDNIKRQTQYYLQVSNVSNGAFTEGGEVCLKIYEEGKEPSRTPLAVETELECIGGPWGILSINVSGGEGNVSQFGTKDGALIKLDDPFLVVVDDENGCRAISEGFGSCNEEVDCENNDLELIVEIECEKDRFGLPTGRSQVRYSARNGVGNLTYHGVANGGYVDFGEPIQVIVMDESGCLRSYDRIGDCAPYNCSLSDLALQVDVECIDTLWKAKLNVSASDGYGNYTFSGTQDGTLLENDDSYLTIVTDETGCSDSISGTIMCMFDSCVFSGLSIDAQYECIRNNGGNLTGQAILDIKTEGGVGNVQLTGASSGDTVNNGDIVILELSDEWNCSILKEINIECVPTSTHDLNTEGLTNIYPNPSNHWTMISYYSSGADHLKIELLDQSGKTHQILEEDIQEGIQNIPLIYGDVPSGLYFVRCTNQEGKSSRHKLVIRN